MILKTDGIIIRNAAFDDISAIADLESETWGKESSLTPEMIESCLKVFPEGSFVGFCDSKIVGFIVNTRVRYDLKKDIFSWYEVADNGYLAGSFDPKGNTLYGVDLTVKVDCQNMGIGQRLIKTLYRLVLDLNVEQGALGARIPDYHKYASRIPVEDYMMINGFDERRGIPQDPELVFYLREYYGARFEVVKAIPDYFKDPESLNYGILLSWKNLQYRK